MAHYVQFTPPLPSPPQSGDPTSMGVTSEAGMDAHLVIWGTDVNVQETKKRFRDFLETFVDDLPGDEGDTPATRSEPLYLQRLEEVSVARAPSGKAGPGSACVGLSFHDLCTSMTCGTPIL